MITEVAVITLIYIAFMAFTAKRMMTYMHVLQQEDYENERLFKWMRENRVFDKRLSIGIFILGAASFILPVFITGLLVFLCFTLMAYMEKDPRKSSKKKLVETARAQRIFFPAYITAIILGIWCFFGLNPWLWIINIQLIPFVLIMINSALQPFEKKIQQKYWDEAHDKIQQLQPVIIGITGSFGKTSVKHMLGHILKVYAPTLITPGSVNTPMGISRVIREELDENHKYLVVEMGAYGPGSIEGLCKLTPPDFGIITSLGHAHYERFKSLETVAEAKFELAQSVLEKSGKIIAHEKTLRFPHSMQIKTTNRESFVVCGEIPDASDESFHVKDSNLIIKKVEQKPEGLEVVLKWKKDMCYIDLPLYGIHHAHNAALAFAAAVTIGVPVDDVITAFKSLPQIQHRLEVKKHPDGTIIIDDAFNSNPLGFRSALDLVSLLDNDGRNILITPGMVELGAAHNEAHESLGSYAGEICDIAIVVNSKRIESFITGFEKTGGNKTLIKVDSFHNASQWIAQNKQPGDTILIENDLPDMYERVPKF